MSLLTLYTWPKPFTEPHIATIQRNAVRSWLQLEPKPRIVVFGNEPGVKEFCSAFDLRRADGAINVIDGTVRIRDLAAKAEEASDSPFYCFINADIVLTGSIMQALASVSERFPRFLLGASPWNVNITEDLTFPPGWEADMERRARAENDLRSRVSSDFFLYPKGYLERAPGVLVGRPYVDNGLMWFTREQGDPLVDGTPGILSVHQNHHYKHFGEKAERKGETPGAHFNIKALGGRGRLYTWSNATHHYTGSGIQPYRAGRICRWSTHAVGGPLYAKVFNRIIWKNLARGTGPVRRALGVVNAREC